MRVAARKRKTIAATTLRGATNAQYTGQRRATHMIKVVGESTFIARAIKMLIVAAPVM
jgi:hypothetical protein